MTKLLLQTLAVLAVAVPLGAEDPSNLHVPMALKPGDTIALVSPARPISADTITSITLGLESMGYHVVEAKNLRTVNRYLAGTDQDRAAGFNAAWADPEVDALFCPGGGFGATRILDMIDYETIRKNPKIFTGFSDITAVHQAIYTQTGNVAFHAPTTWQALANRRDLRPLQATAFWDTLSASTYADGHIGYVIPTVPDNPPVKLVGGKATGRLIGGNLSLVHALTGTKYDFQPEGHILFLEEIREAPYRIDRMLSTLRLAGKLDKLEGVVIGQFYRCDPDEPDNSFTVRELMDQYFGDKPYPVLLNYPVGHVENNTTIPVGALAELDADKGTIRLLENPVRLK
ncbi:LD-carboxypeptidase [bacterium]|nr:LD-carboxypeptidase [bacterium]